jgi:hypothetical protein
MSPIRTVGVTIDVGRRKRRFLYGGTGGSNPVPSSVESGANPIDVASLAPNAEITVYPWKEPAELKQRTIARVRRFLKAHVPMRAAAH